MGRIDKFKGENLVIGVLSAADESESELRTRLSNEFGPVDLASDPLDFIWTHYYDREMGGNISRWFYSFERLTDPSELSDIKIKTNEIEKDYRQGGDRKVNLDPGLLDLNRLILATTKNVGHRIPLRDGIYAEVTLMYMRKDFHPLPWTYPDYADSRMIGWLHQVRRRYMHNLKAKMDD